jgi:putative phosphatase
MLWTLWVSGSYRGLSGEKGVAYVTTLWIVPRIVRVTGPKRRLMLGPDRFAPRLFDVTLRELEEAGLRGLIVDLDNTLLGFRESELAQEHLAWVKAALDYGFKMVMVSNNFTGRVTGIAATLGIPCIPNALKPLPFGIMRALRILGLRRRQVAVVGDQLFTDVLGGKLCGLYTILTEPIETKDFAVTRMFRFFERLMLPQRRTP